MLRIIAATAAGALLAAACAEPTPYQPTAEGGRYGYEETRIEDDRFRISFSGNALTDRDTVELFLLYRAAELTLEEGYDYFRVTTRDVEADRQLRSTGGYSAFDVRYRYFHPRYGWYGWRDPFWNDVNIRETTRYEALAEIVMGRGPAPDTADAFDAQQVVRNLQDDIVRPETG